MNKKIIRFLSIFGSLEILIYLVFSVLFDKMILFNSIEKLFTFHFFVFSSIFILLVIVNHYFSSATGFAFTGFGLIQMGVNVYFLWGLIESSLENKTIDVLLFFGSYFILLLIFTILTIKLLFNRQITDCK